MLLVYRRKAGDAAADDGNADDSFTPLFISLTVMMGHSSNLMQVAPLDKDMVAWFRQLKKLGLMERTVFVINSDHGIHGSKMNHFASMEYEHRNPLAYLIASRRFFREHPATIAAASAAAAVDGAGADSDGSNSDSDSAGHSVGALQMLQRNARTRYYTQLDLYKTLLSLPGVDAFETDRTATATVNYDLLTELISDQRNCDNAGIPKKWCMCFEFKPGQQPDAVDM
jgi:hypothetical protein